MLAVRWEKATGGLELGLLERPVLSLRVLVTWIAFYEGVFGEFVVECVALDT